MTAPAVAASNSPGSERPADLGFEALEVLAVPVVLEALGVLADQV